MRPARLATLVLAVALAGCGSQSPKPSELGAAERRLNSLVEQRSHGRETVEIVSKESLRRSIERYQTLQQSLRQGYSGNILRDPTSAELRSITQPKRASKHAKLRGEAILVTGLRPGEAAPHAAINRLTERGCKRVLAIEARAYCMTDGREAAEALP
jgi:hypothetical protein